MQKITPFLWFNNNAEEAIDFYCSVFKKAKKGRVTRYTEVGPGKAGSVMTVEFEIDGQGFMALNGGPHFKFTEAVSFVIDCDSQEEIDYYWEKLSAGGQEVQCGWLKDRFGLSWQVTPRMLGDLLSSGDAKKVDRVMRAMMEMVKLDLAKLQAAAEETD